MIRTGEITGSEVKKNRDGAGNRRLLQVEISDPDDIQTVELMSVAGEDVNPPVGNRVLIVDVGAAYKIAIAADDGIEPSMDEGEKKLYSIGGGSISAFINLLNTGILELNGNADFAVRFNALQTAFDEMKTDLNNFITVFNTHTQAVSGGVAAAPVGQATASAADISGAKIDEIKVP